MTREHRRNLDCAAPPGGDSELDQTMKAKRMLDLPNAPTYPVGQVNLTCITLCAASSQQIVPELSAQILRRLQVSRQVVDNILKNNIPAYGITTGVGSQKNHVVGADAAADYNRRLIRGHGTRVPGGHWPPEIVRGALVVMLNTFAAGRSGVSPALAQLIAEKIQVPAMPEIDTSGSVGASDLVPLAQLAEWLLNSPEAKAADLPRAKEALSLMNSNAFSLSAGAHCIEDLRALMTAYSLAAATTMEGFRCNPDAISTEVNAAHCRPGQASVATRLRAHLDGSALWQPDAPRLLQDPLSFRNISQVQGAAEEVLERLTQIWEEELNSVNDNPIVNCETGRAYSHGNMDTTRQTLALDTMRQAMAKLADVAGERIHKLQWPAFTGLPIGLASEGSPIGGVQFLNLGHIAASTIAVVKIHATPHLLDSVGQIADGVEDTSGQAMQAVQQLRRLIDESWKVVALELAVAVWAIDRRGIGPAILGRDVREVFDLVRPLLPIGSEGQEVFDLGGVVDAVIAYCTAHTELSPAQTLDPRPVTHTTVSG